jgi:hydroxyethylthiazole kinase
MQNNQASQMTALLQNLEAVRAANPLIHNITNYVVMQQTANALLALGASPVMAHASEEIQEMVQLAKALVINIGTLDREWITSMQQALVAAQIRRIPVVLDPVGAGATTLRTQTAHALLNLGSISVVRGNAAEILALAGSAIKSKGVDSQYNSNAALDAAMALAEKYQCVIVISGKRDFIISSEANYFVDNGHHMMSKVTGMGCTATALIGAFCAVNEDFLSASTYAMAVMGIVGEMAIIDARGPGSFQAQFIDHLYNLRPDNMTASLKLGNA